MTGKTVIRIIIMISALATLSCASKNFTTTLVPVERPCNDSDVRFRIVDVTPLHPDEFFISGYTDSNYWFKKIKDSGHMDELAVDMQKKACSLYPDLFSRKSTALPLGVSIMTRYYKNTSTASSLH